MIRDPARQAIIKQCIEDFDAVLPDLQALPHQAIHNDANDYNILVTGDLETAPSVILVDDLSTYQVVVSQSIYIECSKHY